MNLNNLTPKEVFCGYLKFVLRESKLITGKEIKKIFLMALDDYFKSGITVKDLAGVASELYFGLFRPHEVDAFGDHDLSKCLSLSSEIDYDFEHKDDSEKTRTSFERTIKILKQYLQTNG